MSLVTHKAEVQAAIKTGQKLQAMQDAISPSKHPRNMLTQVYRTTRKLVFNNFDNPPELRNILFLFNTTVRQIVSPMIGSAEILGTTSGQASLQRRKIETTLSILPPASNLVTPTVDSVMGIVESQSTQALTVALTGGAVERVIGDGVNSVGFFSQGIVNKQLNIFLTATTVLATQALLERFISQEIASNIFYKQAVAVIDEVVTECCLLVHGQFQPQNSDFQLLGSPRFADAINNPPFHWYCRTVTALVHVSERFDNITQEMLRAAAREIFKRGDTNYRVEIHPAFAFSGR